MSMAARVPRVTWWSWTLLALTVGCATAQVPLLGWQLDCPPNGAPDENIAEQRLRRTEEAVHQFESKRDFAEFQAALACWNRGDLKGCREGLERLLGRNPNHRDAQPLMAEVCLAENQRRETSNQVETAIWDPAVQPAQATTPAAAECPDPGCPITSLCFVSPPQASDPAGPADGVNRVDSTEIAESDQAGALIRRGDAALAAGSLEEAMIYFREAAAARPQSPQIPISAAVAALRHNHPDLAIELLRSLADRFAGSVQVHRTLGVAYYRLGDYKSSQVALQQALSLDKSSALTYFLMGCTLAKLGQSESAEAHLRQARTINPRYTARR